MTLYPIYALKCFLFMRKNILSNILDKIQIFVVSPGFHSVLLP